MIDPLLRTPLSNNVCGVSTQLPIFLTFRYGYVVEFFLEMSLFTG